MDMLVRNRTFRRLVAGIAAATALGTAGTAFAATTGAGRAYGLNVTTILPIVGLTVPLGDTGEQAAPGDFNVTTPTVQANVTVGIPTVLTLTTGDIVGHTESHLNLNQVTSTASVAGLAANIGAIAPLPAVLALTAGVINSEARATCVGGVVQRSGTTELANITATVFGNAIPVVAGTYTTAQDLINVSLLGATVRLTVNDLTTTGNRLAVSGLRLVVHVPLPVVDDIDIDVALARSEVEMPNCAAAPGSVTITVPPVTFSNQNSVPVGGTCTYGASDVTITVTDVEPPATTNVSTTVPCDATGHYATNMNVSSQNDGNVTFTAVQDTEQDSETVNKNTAVPNVAITSAPDPINAAAPYPNYTVSGSCTTGAGNVSVVIGSLPAVSVPCTGGAWTHTADVSGVAEGTVTVTATQTNVNGEDSDTRDVLKDTNPPIVTVDADPINAGNQDTYTFGGTCEIGGSTVTVTIGTGPNAIVLTVPCDGTGHWTAGPVDVSELPRGEVPITATQTDPAGNPGSGSAAPVKSTAGAGRGGIAPVPVGGVWAGLLLLATGLGFLRRRKSGDA